LRNSESDLRELIEYFSFFSILPNGTQNQQSIPGRSDWVERAISATNVFFKDLEEVSDMVITEPFSDGKSLLDFEGFEDFVHRLQDSLPKLDDWLSMKKSIIFLEKAGLEDFLERARESEVEPDMLDKVFLKGFYSRLLSELYANDEVLNSFSTNDHNLLVKEFRTLDSKQQLYARKRLASLLAQRVPVSNLVNSGSAETSILRREIAKKRRNKSIRRLFSEIPNLLQVLKPCMMMSPLSVSVFTNPERFRFDVAIFDEASQVFPEDSVGAIMRAKQVVVVGDNKQLPPTSFFRISEPDEAELTDEENDLESLESILDECSTAGLPEKKLLWHYRSRHESLIAFSNYHFYMNRLSTFPSSSFDGLDSGICFEYVSNGVYDRAKSRKNIEEARRVAEMVMSHAKTKAGVSLGVVAFSEAQQTAILDRIEELRSQDQSVEDFFGEDELEPFFVKNLENVQGDERDEMIFSIGYGRDASGKLTMNFGPLNKNGGERRLNVAITRAKKKVTVVSSIRGGDISAEIQTPGVRALREYLNYAEQGGSKEFLLRETENTGGEFESPFETEVYEELTARGFNVHK
ncbi:MAG: DNA2/NAM7 family helicase, partial [Mesotoga sp.]|nr:DNA2/NAM7 family helicase [Mesotoga sp.]